MKLLVSSRSHHPTIGVWPTCACYFIGVAGGPWAAGCQPTTEPTTSATAEGSAAQVEAVEPASTALYEAHEWGLLRFQGEMTEAATSSPTRPPSHGLGTYGIGDGIGIQGHGAHGGKPVIYLVPLEGHDSSTPITVTAELAGGDLVETWPVGARNDTDTIVTWDGVRISAETCTGEATPAPDSEFCVELREREEVPLCEAGEVRDYILTAEPCLQVGETPTPVLLYNGYMPASLVAPVNVSDGTVTVGEQGVAHLWVLHDSGMAYYEGLAAGEEVTEPTRWLTGGAPESAQDDQPEMEAVPAEESVLAILMQGSGDPETLYYDRDVLLESLYAVMEAEGAHRPGHFADAWLPDVLSITPPWRAFGFYESEAVNELIPLTFEPAPQRIDRWLAFSVEIDAPVFPEPVFAQASAPGGFVANGAEEALEPSRWRIESWGPPAVEGELDAEIVQRVLREHRPEMILCLDAAMMPLNSGPQTTTLEFVIDESGAVSNAVVSGNTGLADATRCLERVARRWRFPEPHSGVVRATMPLTFVR